ncbi:MAG: DoxX family protein [Bacteroidetes bacterium]|nr:DoxX family protein [Bacteroidota bacterium]MBS1740340.1 DoxX family protein [Bacteroidota bacterium]
MKYILWFLRIVVGILFIFSGLVKANDPLGLSYKMNEFFEVWGMAWAMKYSLTMSVAMIGFEIIAGVALLIGAAFRIFSFLLLLLTTFFTFLTAYVYLTDKIKECGCFGDCIKISNAETFWKDVILLILVIILFLFRKRIKPLFSGYPTAAIIILTTFSAFFIQWWVLEHLPFYDCLPYKVGVNVYQKTQIPPGAIPDQYETVMIYEKNGQKQEFTMQNYPWQDSTWKFVDSKSKLIKKGNAEPEIKDFIISDFDKNDHTQEILTAPGYVILWFVKDPSTARTDNLVRIKQLMQSAAGFKIPFYVLSSGNKEVTDAFAQAHQLFPGDYMVLDATASKTAMRSNPGIMILKDGVIQNKLSFRDYPSNISLSNGLLNLEK